MKNILNRRVLIAIFLCAVIVSGFQLAFAEPASAAKYKKFDSGSSSTGTYKYTSYIKGTKNIRIDLTYDGKVFGKITLTKGKTKLKITSKFSNTKASTYLIKHNGKSIKKLYKTFIKAFAG